MGVIDIEQNAASLKIPKEIYVRILLKAIEQTQGDVAQCENAVCTGDFDVVQSIAHRLKGDYANMRIETLSGIARQMNEIAKTDKDKEKLTALLQQFKNIFVQVQEHVHGLTAM